MEFSQPRGIYQQIADQMCDRVLREDLLEGERIPSIRELAAEIGVNPNTVTKTYQSLTDLGVIENQRGRGYFVAEGAREKILRDMRESFVRDEIPQLYRRMQLLGFPIEELAERYRRFIEGEKE